MTQSQYDFDINDADKLLSSAKDIFCDWCGDQLDPDIEWRDFRYPTGQVQYLCDSDRCQMRHHAYNAKCKCGWWHTDNHCPKCGECAAPESCFTHCPACSPEAKCEYHKPSDGGLFEDEL